MAIKKKVQLYVSEATGNTKTAKYYRVHLGSDSQPYDILDNPYKGLVRLYCRIVGDRIEYAPVIRQAPEGVQLPAPQAVTTDDGATVPLHLEECDPSIMPKELLNDGESFAAFHDLSMDGSGTVTEFDTIAFFSASTGVVFPVDSETVRERLKFTGDNKAKLFTRGNPICSDTYTELSTFVPDTWMEFDSFDAVLTDIRNWIDGTDEVADRTPDYPTTIVNSKRLKNIVKEVCTISGTNVNGEAKSGETVVESSAASEGYASYMERIKLDNPTLQGDTLNIECQNYYTNQEDSRAKLSVFGKKENGDIVEFPDTVTNEGGSRVFKATVTNVSEFKEILFHLYSRKSGGGQSVNTKVTFTV